MMAFVVGMIKNTGDDGKMKKVEIQDDRILENLPLTEFFTLIDQGKTHLHFMKEMEIFRWGEGWDFDANQGFLNIINIRSGKKRVTFSSGYVGVSK